MMKWTHQMTEQTDFIQRVNGKALGNSESIIRSLIPGGKVVNGRYVVCNPSRPDKSAGSFSVEIESGMFNDHADDESRGGDLVALTAFVKGWRGKGAQLRAARWLNETHRLCEDPFRDRIKQNKPIVPDPPEENRMFSHNGKETDGSDRLGVPHEVYTFYDQNPEAPFNFRPLFAECIFYLPQWKKGKVGKLKKETRPFDCRAFQEGKPPWKIWKLVPGPRPLYRLRFLVEDEANKPILLVEGAKTARFLNEQMMACWDGDPPYIVMSWYGGSGKSGIDATDWTCLKGRKVFIIPDDDLPGRKAALEINLKAWAVGAKKVIIIDAGDKGGDGFDVGDYDQGKHGPFKAFLGSIIRRENLYDTNTYQALLLNITFNDERRKQVEKAAESIAAELGQRTPEKKAKVLEKREGDRPFRVMGVGTPNTGKAEYHFFSGPLQRCITLSNVEIGKREHLTELANEGWWETTNPTTKKSNEKVDWSKVGSQLKEECQRAGVVDPSRQIRGKGCWRVGKEEDMAIHFGDMVYTGGLWLHPMDVQRDGLIFQRETPIDYPVLDPISRSQFIALQEYARSFAWMGGKLAADLAIGWAIASVFCGYFDWRPHLLITGPSLSGKTTASRELIGRIQGKWKMPFESKTTEAGVRRTLDRSAIPILFDEFETSKMSAHRTGEIIRLLRASSSESGGEIQHGDGRSYRIRSMACLSSIIPGLEEAADLNRFIVLELKNQRYKKQDEKVLERKRKFDELGARLAPDLDVRLFWYVVERRRILREILPVFQRAASQWFGNQRLGDTLAPVLACFFLLHDDNENRSALALSEAKAFMARYSAHDWELIFQESANNDEEDLIQRILSVFMRDSRLSIRDALDILFAETLFPYSAETYEDGRPNMNAVKTRAQRMNSIKRDLAAHGIKLVEDRDDCYAVRFARNMQTMDEALKDTRWKSGKTRGDALSHMQDATTDKTSFAGYHTRYVQIPSDIVGLEVPTRGLTDEEVFH